MQYLSASAANGSWAGYGTLGFWTPAAGVASPPAGTTVTGPNFSPNVYGGTASNRMELPPPDLVLPNTYAGAPDILIPITPAGAIDMVVSLRLLAPSSRTATVDLQSPDGSVTHATSGLTADYAAGLWVRFRVTGACRLRISGTTAPRYQGLLFDPYGSPLPGRLLCLGSGGDGLAYIS